MGDKYCTYPLERKCNPKERRKKKQLANWQHTDNIQIIKNITSASLL